MKEKALPLVGPMEKFCATLVCVIADLIMHSGSASWAASESAVGKCWTAASKLVGFPNSRFLSVFLVCSFVGSGAESAPQGLDCALSQYVVTVFVSASGALV